MERHSKTHNEDAMKATKRTEKMRKHMPSEFDPITQKIIKAEVLATHFIAEHNLPIAVADHFTPLVKKTFPDSNIAKGFSWKDKSQKHFELCYWATLHSRCGC